MRSNRRAGECFVGLDLGTSACKAIAADGAGAIVARAATEYPLSTPQPGWAEQDPSAWWRAADLTMRALRTQLPSPGAVQAIGLSGQMHGLVALDRADDVIRPAMLWCDQRGLRQSDALTERVGGLEALVAQTANRLWPCDTAGKVLWLREEEPRAYRRLRRFLNPKDYLRLRMTGEHATDVSDASGTGMFDVRHRRWSARLLDEVGLSPGQVPIAYESHETTGRLRPEVADGWGLPRGTPVVGGGGDSVAQTTAMGVVSEGPLGVILGTAGVVAGATPACPENRGGWLQVSCGNAPDRWHAMGVSLNGGGAFQWLLETLREVPGAVLDLDALTRLAAEAPAGSEGLLFLPHLMGERCPHVAGGARGALVGLTRAHRLGELVRSVMEGIVLNLRAILELFLAGGWRCDELRASGGSTASPFWLSLLADGLGRDVVTVTGASAGGAYGAALLAGVGACAWRGLDEAVRVIREAGRVRPEPERASRYRSALPVHERAFAALDSRPPGRPAPGPPPRRG
ncbi:MAG TPA: xylulokinase [Anaeromyxobacter sp.]|nr:xylulokinase [Anaeromyxobacter sp.]HVP62957.1 xylulokinase [Myxococcaceae bacterium]